MGVDEDLVEHLKSGLMVAFELSQDPDVRVSMSGGTACALIYSLTMEAISRLDPESLAVFPSPIMADLKPDAERLEQAFRDFGVVRLVGT